MKTVDAFKTDISDIGFYPAFIFQRGKAIKASVKFFTSLFLSVLFIQSYIGTHAGALRNRYGETYPKLYCYLYLAIGIFFICIAAHVLAHWLLLRVAGIPNNLKIFSYKDFATTDAKVKYDSKYLKVYTLADDSWLFIKSGGEYKLIPLFGIISIKARNTTRKLTITLQTVFMTKSNSFSIKFNRHVTAVEKGQSESICNTIFNACFSNDTESNNPGTDKNFADYIQTARMNMASDYNKVLWDAIHQTKYNLPVVATTLQKYFYTKYKEESIRIDTLAKRKDTTIF